MVTVFRKDEPVLYRTDDGKFWVGAIKEYRKSSVVGGDLLYTLSFPDGTTLGSVPYSSLWVYDKRIAVQQGSPPGAQ
ncbi:hypothetical protein DACRYDRAFT_112061 [Dacryopinax primogenitus]|uniref:Tudor domain-containing protein n=1 Tax=Dacryopinax primogenitus (strain DJM 731) TaxID=1858805 RepID=M5FUY9_DACPD|nr:uncharacterized protein DACRYDRAFT_112061 [Dacryopinax primogenitus]EJT97101.1 hypothetical protein DACRYDRAFT_112061 [Dacryopinax primogenitus]